MSVDKELKQKRVRTAAELEEKAAKKAKKAKKAEAEVAAPVEVVDEAAEKAAKKAAKKAKKAAEAAAPAEEEPAKVEEEPAKAEQEEEEEAPMKVHKKEPVKEAAGFEDKTLNCRDCQAEFVFTAGQQEFFATKGFANGPTRCKECQAAKKARFGEEAGSGGKSWGNDTKSWESKGPMKCYNCGGEGHMSRDCPDPKKEQAPRVCFAFQKGQCDRGDGCKFAHTAN